MKKTARHIFFHLIFLSLVLIPLASAQQPAARPAGKVIVHAGKLLDVRTGKTLTDQAIVIEGDRISSVGPFAQARRSADDRLVDLSNATVLPGLTDAHTHLTMNPQDVGPRGLTISIPRETLTGARNARITLEAGFTTVRNVGADGYSDVALRDAINDGDVPGPRMLVSGPPLGITGGHCDENLLPYEYHYSAEGVADGVEGVQHKVRETIKIRRRLDQNLRHRRRALARRQSPGLSLYAGGVKGDRRRRASSGTEGGGPCPWGPGHSVGV